MSNETSPQTGTAPARLRDAGRDEAEEIGALIGVAYAQYEPRYPPESWQRFHAAITDMAQHFDYAQVIVAEADGRIVGTITFYEDGHRSGQGDWPEGWAGAVRLAVHPDYRGRGIGRALMEECIRRCREAGVATLGLHTTEWMAVALAMYERMGFVRVPEFDFFPRSGIHVYGYRLEVA